jgi:hypothetical protein
MSNNNSAPNAERFAPAAGATAIDAQNPWLGLTSFTEETRGFFYGREEEAGELCRRVQRKPLTILFGQSGLGKTSILQAGLVPRLRPEGFCPVYVRLDYNPEAPSPSEQIKRAVFRATEAAGTWTQSGTAVQGETLWEFLHHRDDVLKDAAGRTLIPILIFDQFEEIFTLAQSDDFGRKRSREFLADLADLVENRPPAALEARIDREEADAAKFDFARADYRILISLREDYLANLEALKGEMPSVTQNRMRLARMTGAQAIAAVRGPAPALVSEGVAAAIVRFVSGGAELAHAEVEPSLLSLICRELNNTRLARGQKEISSDLLAGSRDNILQEFYQRAVGDQPEGVRRFVEEELLTESGYRENIALERAQKSLAAAGAELSALDTLVNRRLLRVEERLDIRRIELMHDVLCAVVKASRDVRHEREAKAAIEQQLAETRAKEEAARRALSRARLVAAVCAVLMVLAAGSAVFGYINLRRARAADAQAQVARQLAESARSESEKLIGFLIEDFYQELMPTGQVEIVGNLADKAVAYYDGLPAELMSKQTKLYRGMALVRKASSLNESGKFAQSKTVSDQARKIFEDLRAAGDQSDEVATALALAIFSKLNIGGLGDTRAELEKAVGLLRPLVANGRATRSARLALGDILQYLAHSEPRAEDAIVECEESRKILAGMGALDLSDLTAASIYGDVTDSQSRMAKRLGRLGDAEKLAVIVHDIAEKVLEQRPGDLRAMKNRYFSANMMASVAASRHDLAKAEKDFVLSEDAALYYTRFNPADSLGWNILGTALGDVAQTWMDQGRVTEAMRKIREAASLAHDARNKTGISPSVYGTTRELVVWEARRGNVKAAKTALADARRIGEQFEKDRNIDEELAGIAQMDKEALEFPVLEAEGDYSTIHARAVDIADRLAKIKIKAEGNRDFWLNAQRRSRVWQLDSALRLGRAEEALAVAQQALDHPVFSRRVDQDEIEAITARMQVRLGQARLGAGRRAEALTPLREAEAHYRRELAQGATDTGFRVDFARALLHLALAQADDEAGRAQRISLLNEATAALNGLSLEARLLQPSQELIRWVAEARAQSGPKS